MEIRTLEAGERDEWLDLLNGWDLPDDWTGRDFFGRWIELDPTWQDENVWVAEDAGRLVSTVQIFPRELRVLDHAVPTGGIGSVYTREEHRRDGIAGAILDEVVVEMRERGMELSLLFGVRLDFYGKHGWASWKNQRAWMGRSGEARPGGAKTDDVEISRFDWDRDLAEVTADLERELGGGAVDRGVEALGRRGMQLREECPQTIHGGGITGQAGALRHGIARALLQHNPELRSTLKAAGFLTRDSREVERKKCGQPGARKRFQFSKR